ncbi:hypothetical protein K7G91_000912 [Pasteurella canis]|uniref:hypothetical protein n=1 Tax=Pasteurella canis TaxID=753 RepID=UPI000665D1CC|nr:hypothetical protein [Pasteurella canis]UDW84625.1 hypothetical protein K7G91_000912 [Pasteurella canis]
MIRDHNNVIYYDQLAEDIALLSGGIPDIAIGQIIPLCMQQYAADSLSLVEEVTGRVKNGIFEPENGCSSYLSMSSRYDIVSVDSVTRKNNSVPVIPRYESTSPELPSCSLVSIAGKTPELRFFGHDDSIDNDTRVMFIIAPKRNATHCVVPRDRGLFIRTVTALCLYYLYNMPNRDWSNMDLAAQHYAIYHDLIVESKRKSKGNDMRVVRECKFSW